NIAALRHGFEEISVNTAAAIFQSQIGNTFLPARDNILQIKEYALHLRIFFENRADRETMPATYVHNRLARREIVSLKARADRHRAEVCHCEMKTVELYRVAREIFEGRFAGNMFNRGLSGANRMQQLSSDVEVKWIGQPDHGVAHRLWMVRAQELGWWRERKMPRTNLRENAGHGQQAQDAKQGV